MIKFEALYQLLMDDLTDADMLIDYACKIREESEEDENLAKTFKNEAEERLAHFTKFHNVFEDQVEQYNIDKQQISYCLWQASHTYCMNYKDKIDKKIKDF